MTCYTKYIANKSHKQVLDIVDKVLTGKKTSAEASKELQMPEKEFNELYKEITSKMILA